MYFLAVQELAPLSLHMDVKVGDEVSERALAKYDEHLHEQVFPPADKSSVKEMAGDGHQKIACSCTGPARRGSGRPRSRVPGRQKDMTHGWFLITDPRTSRVLSVVQQVQPEDNSIKAAALGKVMHMYPNCDCFIHDRNCSFEEYAHRNPALEQLHYYPTDKWHGFKHKEGCPNSPYEVPRLRRRVRGLNTSVAEQVFGWFRGYTKILNYTSPLRHKFLVLYFCKVHNSLVDEGNAKHLPAITQKTKMYKSRPYDCNDAKGKKNIVRKKPALKSKGKNIVRKKPASKITMR